MDEDLGVPCRVKELGAFRIDSFNYFVHNINKLCADIEPVYVSRYKIFVSNIEMKCLQYPMDTRHTKKTVFPSEARLRQDTYRAELHVESCLQIGENQNEYFTKVFYVPVMVKSDLCFVKRFIQEQLMILKDGINNIYFLKQFITEQLMKIKEENTNDPRPSKKIIEQQLMKMKEGINKDPRYVKQFVEDQILKVQQDINSDAGFLQNFIDEQLIKLKEDINDPGGYFIIKGKERIFRHFVVKKRNYPLAVIQSKWRNYREGYSEYGIIVRSVKDEFIFSTTFLHYLTNGGYECRFYCNLTPLYVQVCLILKALVDKSDRDIFYTVMKYSKDFPRTVLKSMLLALQDKNIYSHHGAKEYLGAEFSRILKLPSHLSNSDAADYVLRKSLLVHLESNEDKFEFICFSLCKLHSVVTDKCRVDDLDNPVFQEVLSTGQIYSLMIKDGLKKYIQSVQRKIKKDIGDRKQISGKFKSYCTYAKNLSPELSSMIATGNFVGQNYGLSSNTGYTIAVKSTNVFEKAAQFTAICKFSLEHYSKNMRKFYPESWGFICPTQTPEGENTGLYNQLASQCKIVNLSSKRIEETILFEYGVVPIDNPPVDNENKIYPVVLDGRLVGWIRDKQTEYFIFMLRKIKSSNNDGIPYHSEIVFITESQKLFPAFYLFSTPCRLIRKILIEPSEIVESQKIMTKHAAFIGMFEQVFYSDSCIQEVHNYSEITDANILSLSARTIPYCENNAAVRNIYSSVKIKQALGLPFTNFSGRSDTKTFHLIYGQHPVVSTKMYSVSDFNFYPCGTNVIVAVISYSGYDMEDALVLNKASVERGLMQNVEYKTFFYDFKELSEFQGCSQSDLENKRDDNDPYISYILDEDGLPYIGTLIKPNDPVLSLFNKKTQQYVIECYPERHTSYVHAVRITGDIPKSSTNIPKSNKKISITFCVKKVPEAGDKFNTRHGGKGICGKIMESESMPFSEDGMIPDVLFNPHGIPTRESIGLLFEMGASKASIGKGKLHTVEPFQSKHIETYEEIGNALAEAGFDYYGTETFYSGTSGEELSADVFCGSLYYLRLHHVVEEKYQVQSVGKVDERTNQPINPGKSGSVRFGEMEKDAILSHGAMVLALDRLLLNSDKCTAFVCRQCKLLIPPSLPSSLFESSGPDIEQKYCRLCDKISDFKIQIPYVLQYLITELNVLGITIRFSDT